MKVINIVMPTQKSRNNNSPVRISTLGVSRGFPEVGADVVATILHCSLIVPPKPLLSTSAGCHLVLTSGTVTLMKKPFCVLLPRPREIRTMPSTTRNLCATKGKCVERVQKDEDVLFSHAVGKWRAEKHAFLYFVCPRRLLQQQLFSAGMFSLDQSLLYLPELHSAAVEAVHVSVTCPRKMLRFQHVCFTLCSSRCVD